MYISPFSQQMCVSIPNPWNERAQSTQLWSRWTEVEYMSLSVAPPTAAENSGLNKTTWDSKVKEQAGGRLDVAPYPWAAQA